MDEVKRVTGTTDVNYDLVSVIYHALQGAETYEKYIQDADEAGDRELSRFLRDVQEENRRRAGRAKELLRERLEDAERGGRSGNRDRPLVDDDERYQRARAAFQEHYRQRYAEREAREAPQQPTTAGATAGATAGTSTGATTSAGTEGERLVVVDQGAPVRTRSFEDAEPHYRRGYAAGSDERYA